MRDPSKAKVAYLRKKSAKDIAIYYGATKTKSVHTGRVGSMARTTATSPMPTQDSRVFRGEKVTPEEIANWERNNIVKVYSHTGRQL